jgi:hypothetical protein
MDATTSFPADSAPRLAIARLGRSRLAIGVVGLGVIAVAAAWQWSWLVAIGVAPVLLSVAPCAAMCGLGLCMHRIGGGSCGAAASQAPAIKTDRGVENLTVAQSNQGEMT